MILNTEKVKNACSKILVAIDSNSESNLTDLLELKTENKILYLNVTNNEYFVKVKLSDCDEDFHATVRAELFLKLISHVTTEDIEFKVVNNSLVVTANGTSNFALVYNNMGSEVVTLPEISISNITSEFNINSNILNSIYVNNSKELSKISKTNYARVNPVQKMYYIDEKGAITFYTGACVNRFNLEKPVKILLNSNLVKLFTLFKDTSVKFSLGYDPLSDTIIQTKVKFETDDIYITAILNYDESLLKMMPAEAIRERAFNEYSYIVTINRSEFLGAIKRVLLFANENIVSTYKTCGIFSFGKSSFKISDCSKETIEELHYANELTSDIIYEAKLDLTDIKLSLENNSDQYITLGFGDSTAMVIAKDNIYTVIPEMEKD